MAGKMSGRLRALHDSTASDQQAYLPTSFAFFLCARHGWAVERTRNACGTQDVSARTRLIGQATQVTPVVLHSTCTMYGAFVREAAIAHPNTLIASKQTSE